MATEICFYLYIHCYYFINKKWLLWVFVALRNSLLMWRHFVVCLLYLLFITVFLMVSSILHHVRKIDTDLFPTCFQISQDRRVKAKNAKLQIHTLHIPERKSGTAKRNKSLNLHKMYNTTPYFCLQVDHKMVIISTLLISQRPLVLSEKNDGK